MGALQPDQHGPVHVEGAIDLAGDRAGVVGKDLDHQACTVGDDHAGLRQAQRPGFPLRSKAPDIGSVS